MTAKLLHRPVSRAANARLLSRTVLRHLRDTPDEAGVGAKAGTLRTMCDHLNALADEATQCSGHDCMGKRENGFSLWVPQDRLDMEIARGKRLAGEVVRLRQALAIIAQDEPPSDSWMDQLVSDGGARGARLQALAAEALALGWVDDGVTSQRRDGCRTEASSS